jgi:hypothetical protein
MTINIYMEPEQIKNIRLLSSAEITDEELDKVGGRRYFTSAYQNIVIRKVSQTAARHAVKQIVEALEPNLGVLSRNWVTGEPAEYILSAEALRELTALAEEK